MAVSIMELKRQIEEKNLILNSLSSGAKKDSESIYDVKKELDRLLYLYYKALKCSCSNILAC